MKPNQMRIALLIDCDNVSSNSVEGVLNKLNQIGIVSVRHAHGDWKSHCMKSWIEKLQPNAIKPLQQFAFTKGKNATDAAIIIDAMDLMYANKVDAFAIMSSDSDYTPLSMRLQENGMLVYGFGEMKTPTSFVRACTEFTFLEKLPSTKSTEKTVIVKQIPPEKVALYNFLTEAVTSTAEEDGWSMLSMIGSYISKNSQIAKLDIGAGKISKILKRSELFEVQMRNANTVMFFRVRGQDAESNVVQLTTPLKKAKAA